MRASCRGSVVLTSRPDASSSAVSTVWSRSTMRGPHRDAMSSLSPTTWPLCDRRHRRPARPRRHRVGGLPAADGVGQEDPVRVRLHDELRRELRIAAAGRGRRGAIGDVVQSEEAQHLPDERRRRHRVSTSGRARSSRSGPRSTWARRCTICAICAFTWAASASAACTWPGGPAELGRTARRHPASVAAGGSDSTGMPNALSRPVRPLLSPGTTTRSGL